MVNIIKKTDDSSKGIDYLGYYLLNSITASRAIIISATTPIMSFLFRPSCAVVVVVVVPSFMTGPGFSVVVIVVVVVPEGVTDVTPGPLVLVSVVVVRGGFVNVLVIVFVVAEG